MSNIETFKAPHGANTAPLHNCGNCVHRYEERMPQQLVKQLVCHRFPPQAFAVPAQGGYQMVCAFPVVQAHQFCHSHTPRDPNGGAVRVEEPESAPTNPIPHPDNVIDG